MTEIILRAQCTERGLSYVNVVDLRDFCIENKGKTVVATFVLEDNVAEKQRLYNYYFGPLLSCAVEGLTNAGYEGVDKVVADYMLMSEMGKGFYKNPKGEMEPCLLSKSKMNKERLLKYVQDVINFLEQTLRMRVPDAQEYKQFKLSGRNLKKPK
jgi:hypothetical protein